MLEERLDLSVARPRYVYSCPTAIDWTGVAGAPWLVIVDVQDESKQIEKVELKGSRWNWPDPGRPRRSREIPEWRSNNIILIGSDDRSSEFLSRWTSTATTRDVFIWSNYFDVHTSYLIHNFRDGETQTASLVVRRTCIRYLGIRF